MDNKKTLHISAGGDFGGIETLLRNIAKKKNNNNSHFCFFSKGFTYSYILEKTKCGCICFSNHRFSKKQLVSLCNYIEENKIERIVLHSDTVFMFLYFLKIIKRYKHIDYYFVGHNCKEKNNFRFSLDFIRTFLIHFYTKKVAKRVNHIICVSKAGKNSYMEILKIKSENITVVYNGIPDDFAMIKKSDKKDNTIVFSYIGRIEGVKGIKTLINAFTIVDSKNVLLNIVGDGNYKKEAMDLAKNDERIVFYPKTKDVHYYLNISDYFIYPSERQEVFGISLVEAMSYGVVPITTIVGGIPEIVDNTNGFLVEPKSVCQLKEAIEYSAKIYNSPEYLSKSASCVERASCFTIDKMITGYEEVFLKHDRE